VTFLQNAAATGTVRGLRNLGNREAGLGRRRRAVDDQDAALKYLAHWLVEVVRVLELLVDELWSASPAAALPLSRAMRTIQEAMSRRVMVSNGRLWSGPKYAALVK
jgi:hypothetical protein